MALKRGEDLTGQRFGDKQQILVLKFVGMKNSRRRYLCRCDAGHEFERDQYRLQKSGNCPECYTLKRRKNDTIHGW